jgi:DNA-directed RNA polymerase subunit RPC12/RpoP
MSEDFNTIAADRIICPHCGGTFEGDNLQMCDLNGAPMEYDCEHCDKGFELTADVSVTYSTRKLKNEEVWYTAQEN